MNRIAAKGAIEDRDAHPGGATALSRLHRPKRIATHEGGRRIGRALIHAGRDIERHRGVAYRERDHMLGGQPTPGLARHRACGHQAAAGLEPDQTAIGGRNPDRAQAIGGMRNADHAAGHRRGRTATGSACAVGQVVGVAGGPAIDRGFG